MFKKSKTIISSFQKITIVPLIFLGFSALIISTASIYFSTVSETKEGLRNLAHALYKICELTGQGDYELENNILMKGSQPFDTSFDIVDDIYYTCGVSATIFYGDTRILTSVRNTDGSRALGTKASPEVTAAVLELGTDFFSANVKVNDVPYFGYYTPLYNSDKSIVGMIFVGTPRHTIMLTILHSALSISLIMIIAIVITACVSFTYARKIVYSLNKIKEFLGNTSKGDINTAIDPYLLERNDEIGEMGRFASLVQNSIIDLVNYDSLTRLHNRRSSAMILSNMVQDYNDKQYPFVVAIGDIDNFKKINDTFGHQAGDEVLRKLSGLFTQHMEQKGYAIRWGGEEFLFIYRQIGLPDALANLEELLNNIRSLVITYENHEISTTMTFGVSDCIDKDINGMLKIADKNLYYGKEHGKNCIIS